MYVVVSFMELHCYKSEQCVILCCMLSKWDLLNKCNATTLYSSHRLVAVSNYLFHFEGLVFKFTDPCLLEKRQGNNEFTVLQYECLAPPKGEWQTKRRWVIASMHHYVSKMYVSSHRDVFLRQTAKSIHFLNLVIMSTMGVSQIQESNQSIPQWILGENVN